MGSSPKPPPPDPALGQAALKQARIAQQQLQVSRRQMNRQARQDKRNYALARDQYQYQKGILDQQMEWAAQDRQREMDVFRPLQDQIISDARAWDSPENMSRRAAQAQADVQQAVGQQNMATSRLMTNMGVNPNSGRFAGAMRTQAFQNAALRAGVQNQTRSQLLNEAQSLRHSAAGLGAPLLGASYGALTGAGNTAGSLMNPYLQANQMQLQGFQVGQQGFANAANTNQSAFNMQNQMYQNQLDIWRTQAANKAARTSAIIGLAGAAAAGPLGAMGFGAMTGAQGGAMGALRGYGQQTYGLQYDKGTPGASGG